MTHLDSTANRDLSDYLDLALRLANLFPALLDFETGEIGSELASCHGPRRLGPRRMLGNPGVLVRNGERRGQDERTHGREEHRQAGAGDEVITSNQLYHGRMSTRRA
jgi:hypothetical protein